jgi:rhodanese-related sulfurtransferase
MTGSRSLIMTRRRTLLGCLLLVFVIFLLPDFARGEGPKIISAEQAKTQAAAGQLLIIDVRTSAEWRETGVPQGAARANIFNADFLERVKRAVGADLSRPIAVICARGNRSTRAEQLLSQAGFTAVQNIKEGMLGSTYGKGWLAGGHPTEGCTGC